MIIIVIIIFINIIIIISVSAKIRSEALLKGQEYTARKKRKLLFHVIICCQLD